MTININPTSKEMDETVIKNSKFKFKILGTQIKAIFLLTINGYLNFGDTLRLWLLAIGFINRVISVCPRPLKGHRVYVRPMTTDLRTLKDTFCHKYHRPFAKNINAILDLGANVGYVAADLAIQYPSAQIITAELDAQNHQMIVRNTNNLNVKALHAAVWIHEDGITYDVTRNEDAYTAVSTNAPTVKSIRMDTLIELMGGWVDYVKMDIEGGERELITENSSWLDSIGLIKIELHVSKEDCDRIAQVLENHGLSVTRDHLHTNTFTAIRDTRVKSSITLNERKA